MNRSSNHVRSDGGSLSVGQFLGWIVLGVALTVFGFFWSIQGLGVLFGGTEVGNGRVPGVGILWWVFMIGVIPLAIIGAIVTPLVITKVPRTARTVLALLGTIALLCIVAPG